MTIHMERIKEEDRYEAEGAATGAATDWIQLTKYNERKALVAVHPIGTMRAEITIDSLAAVDADTARAFPWDDGDVTEDTIISLPNNATAVRFVGNGNYRVVV